MNGVLSLHRTILRPADAESAEQLLRSEGRKYIAPLDGILKIDALPYKITRRMMTETAFWAQNQTSFREASSVIKKIYGFRISTDTVRRVAVYVGALIYQKDTAEAEKIYQGQCRMEMGHSKKGTLYIQTDGAALNTRHKDENGSTWRENKLGIVFSSDNIITTKNRRGEKERHIQKKEYTSYVGSAGEFKKYLFACAVRNGYGDYEKTVVLSDGATWIRNMCEEIFPDAVQILDLYHLCENTYEYAKAIFHEKEEEYRPWAEKVISWLKEGAREKVMTELKKYRKRRLKKGTVNLPVYIENNWHKIDYPEYQKQGFYVGSGAIESGNKVVLQKRLKLAGMRWEPETAQYLLTLRSKYESGLWKEDVEKYIDKYSFE